VAQEVRRSIYILLPSGGASIERIAAELGTTSRTLQRHLDRAGASFAGILNEARRDLVPRYLENRAYSLTQVSELLGYEFPSSFSRWFRGEFGMPPARWRASQAARKARQGAQA
jgi:AraC-like DNA-binding protein